MFTPDLELLAHELRRLKWALVVLRVRLRWLGIGRKIDGNVDDAANSTTAASLTGAFNPILIGTSSPYLAMYAGRYGDFDVMHVWIRPSEVFSHEHKTMTQHVIWKRARRNISTLVPITRHFLCGEGYGRAVAMARDTTGR